MVRKKIYGYEKMIISNVFCVIRLSFTNIVSKSLAFYTEVKKINE